MRWRLSALLGAAALIAALAIPSLVLAGGNPANKLRADLTGGQVVPAGTGAPAGQGNARVNLRPHKNKVCFRVSFKKIGPRHGLNAAIYEGKKGQNGDLFVKLFKGSQKESPVEGCTRNVSNTKIKALRQKPRSYNVDIKTDKYSQGGAIRGQLKPRG